MNILMVLSSGKYPPDRRVEREARDLIRDGHNVLLMARRGPGQSREEIIDGVHVIRVWLPFQNTVVLADLIHYAFQRYWMLLSILLVCRRYRVDALHVHDLPYALATTLAGMVLRRPVVFDTHEHYTDMLKTGFEAPMYRMARPFAGILLRVLRWEERFVGRRVARVIIVAKEHASRIEALGVAPNRITEVTNTEDSDYFAGLSVDPGVAARYRDDFMILYVGAFSPHRGLETAIAAMPTILRAIPVARLVLVGDGGIRPSLERQVASAGLDDRVEFAGYQPFDRLPSYIAPADICLIPHARSPLVDTTMPNKLFQFMILGKPVVVSDAPPMVRVVHDTGCGVTFKDRDAESLARAVVSLEDAAMRQRLGHSGRLAVRDRYNWQVTVQPLLKFYRGLATHQVSE